MIRRSPLHQEENVVSLGARSGLRVAADLDVQNAVHNVGVAVDVVRGGRKGLSGGRACGELVGGVGSPGKEAGNVEDRMDAGHGGRKVELVGDGVGAAGGDGVEDCEGADIAGAELGGGLVEEIDELC
jgi:hypothetical protein